MFQIGRLFHIIHVVDDLDKADRWYDDVFSVTRFYRGYSEVEKRDASLVLIGNFVMEPMMMSRVEGADRTPIGRFYARFRQHLHSIAWFVSDMPSLYQSFREHEIRLRGDGGVLLEAAPARGGMFTHPRDTHCQLEFLDPSKGAPPDPRLKPDWSAAFWRDQHPLGIERTSHITVVVGDLAKARAFYQNVLKATLVHEEVSTVSKTRSAYFAVGEETVVELATPTSKDSPAGQDLEKNGDIIHAVTFKVKDIAKAEGYFKSKGGRIEARQRDSFVLNKEDAFGAVLGFTQRSIPNDPRG